MIILAQISSENIEVYDFDGQKLPYKLSDVHWDSERSEKWI